VAGFKMPVKVIVDGEEFTLKQIQMEYLSHKWRKTKNKYQLNFTLQVDISK
jgi:hypothetical protein